MKVNITKVKDEWVNTPPKGFNVNFERYPTGKDTSFLYKYDFEIIDDELRKKAGFDIMFYGGYHKDDGDLYALSCDLDLAHELVIAPPSKVKKTLHILDWGTEESMKRAEWEYLDKENAVKDKQWFNQQNNFGKKYTPKPDYDKMRKLNHDIDILKHNYKHLESELTYLTFDNIKKPRPAMDFDKDNMKNLQPRDKGTIQKLIKQIKFMIDLSITKGQDITQGAKPIVVVTDRQFLGKLFKEILMCGKHTSQGYIKHKHGKVTKLSWIEIPPSVHELFTDVELMKVANEDNRPETSVEPIKKEDIIKELKFQASKGLEWNTPEEKARADELLKSDSWGSITKSMETWEMDQDRKKNGLNPRINWRDSDRKKEVVEMSIQGMKENPDTWYNPSAYSSYSLRYDNNIMRPFKMWKRKQKEKDKNFIPPKKVVTFVHFSSADAKTEWEKKDGNQDMIFDWCVEHNNKKKFQIEMIALEEFEEDILI
jgi:hypothetical protein|tara:strand:- start:63 stop:1511 length:1449 start_codon:yes stop_codon:yes gene_type:complete